jgi:hypothetical protein
MIIKNKNADTLGEACGLTVEDLNFVNDLVRNYAETLLTRLKKQFDDFSKSELIKDKDIAAEIISDATEFVRPTNTIDDVALMVKQRCDSEIVCYMIAVEMSGNMHTQMCDFIMRMTIKLLADDSGFESYIEGLMN